MDLVKFGKAEVVSVAPNEVDHDRMPARDSSQSSQEALF